MNAAFADALLRLLRNLDLKRLVVVPASGLTIVYASYMAQDRCVFVTREEEGLALAAGLSLGGWRAALLIQQSGVGNAINAALTLANAYDIRFPVFVVDRGPLDDNPVQRASSKGTMPLLHSLGARCVNVLDDDAARHVQDHVCGGVRWFVCQEGTPTHA